MIARSPDYENHQRRSLRNQHFRNNKNLFLKHRNVKRKLHRRKLAKEQETKSRESNHVFEKNRSKNRLYSYLKRSPEPIASRGLQKRLWRNIKKRNHYDHEYGVPKDEQNEGIQILSGDHNLEAAAPGLLIKTKRQDAFFANEKPINLKRLALKTTFSEQNQDKNIRNQEMYDNHSNNSSQNSFSDKFYSPYINNIESNEIGRRNIKDSQAADFGNNDNYGFNDNSIDKLNSPPMFDSGIDKMGLPNIKRKFHLQPHLFSINNYGEFLYNPNEKLDSIPVNQPKDNRMEIQNPKSNFQQQRSLYDNGNYGESEHKIGWYYHNEKLNLPLTNGSGNNKMEMQNKKSSFQQQRFMIKKKNFTSKENVNNLNSNDNNYLPLINETEKNETEIPNAKINFQQQEPPLFNKNSYYASRYNYSNLDYLNNKLYLTHISKSKNATIVDGGWEKFLPVNNKSTKSKYNDWNVTATPVTHFYPKLMELFNEADPSTRIKIFSIIGLITILLIIIIFVTAKHVSENNKQYPIKKKNSITFLKASKKKQKELLTKIGSIKYGWSNVEENTTIS